MAIGAVVGQVAPPPAPVVAAEVATVVIIVVPVVAVVAPPTPVVPTLLDITAPVVAAVIVAPVVPTVVPAPVPAVALVMVVPVVAAGVPPPALDAPVPVLWVTDPPQAAAMEATAIPRKAMVAMLRMGVSKLRRCGSPRPRRDSISSFSVKGARFRKKEARRDGQSGRCATRAREGAGAVRL
jgi:hypothetical protein